MTYTELNNNIKKLKVNDIYCNIIQGYHNTQTKTNDIGLYVIKNNNKWEVYCTERSSAELVCILNSEYNTYEYVYSYFKKISDVNCWFGGFMNHYPEDLIKKIKHFKISESEYSFDGGMPQDCFCVEKREMIDNGEISHNVLKSKDGTISFIIKSDYFSQNGGKVDVWEVYYSDGIKKLSHGIFFQEYEAYDFLFYLVMKKHVDINKRWW